MKCSLAVLATAFTALASAQIPSCAQPCLAAAVDATTSCSPDDVVCQCQSSNQAAIQAAATSCIFGACGSQALSALSAAKASCSNASAAGSTASTAAFASAAPATSSSRDSSSFTTQVTTTSSSARATTTTPSNTIAADLTSTRSKISSSSSTIYAQPPATSSTVPNSGLSTGAKAGLGVGVSLGVILVGIIAGWIFSRRGRRVASNQRARLSAGDLVKFSGEKPVELPAPHQPIVAELPSHVSELPGADY
ncbi:hypothetical protein F5884DRAFT_788537 [Xylogone sp. PMI_703]|nr:hypothetical protein F5884DRAFT_788537 [Xylogone sp. PMI_703]